jgi:hypothetical protein
MATVDVVFERSMKFFVMTNIEFTEKCIKQRNRIKEILLNGDLSPTNKLERIVNDLLSFSLQQSGNLLSNKEIKLYKPGEKYSSQQFQLLSEAMKSVSKSASDHSQFNKQISAVIRSPDTDENKINQIKLLML